MPTYIGNREMVEKLVVRLRGFTLPLDANGSILHVMVEAIGLEPIQPLGCTL